MFEKTFNHAPTVRAAAAILMALLLVSYLGFTPNVSAQAPKKAETPTKASAASESGGQKEGIKVHGHWTIDVRNPDGKLVSHTEFENALQTSGASLLALLLTRSNTPGLWGIVLAAPTGVSVQPCSNTFGNMLCRIDEPGWGAFNNFIEEFTNLVVGVTNGTIKLSGTATAGNNIGTGTSIGFVNTVLEECANTDAPGALGQICRNGGFGAVTFTSTNITPISVSAGQIIQVTVVISFS